MLVWAVVTVAVLKIEDLSEADVFEINEVRVDGEGDAVLVALEGTGGGTLRT